MLQTSENTEAKTILDGLRRIVQALRKASSEAGSQQALTAAQIFCSARCRPMTAPPSMTSQA